IEFRALETMPHNTWMSLTALLWRAILLRALEHEMPRPLAAFGAELHDRFFLPSNLWMDLESLLSELRNSGLTFSEGARAMFREIWKGRFQQLLEADGIVVRRACEDWPLLCETPIEGGHTSRFVDTSMDRLEFSAPTEISSLLTVAVNGRPALLHALADGL